MWKMVLPPNLAGDRRPDRVPAGPAALPPHPDRHALGVLEAGDGRQAGLPRRPGRRSSPPASTLASSPAASASAEPLVVAVGRLVPVKHFDVLIRTMREVRGQIPDARLDHRRRGLRAAGSWTPWSASSTPRTGSTFAGRVDDDGLVDLYRRAWVVASASSHEGWGMTLTEAAACGTPAVATRISGHLDAVEEGVGGLLADDERELVEHLTRSWATRPCGPASAEGARRRAAS